jgi:uncharacterized delta-60 repeat protein
MKKFSTLFATLLFVVTNIFSQAGSLDINFGPGGKVITNIDPINQSDDRIAAMAIQTDGKIVVAGTSKLPDYPTSYVPSIIMRYNVNGTIDNSFNFNGTFLGYGVKFTAVAVQADGKIVGAGTNFSLIRLNPNGTIDNSFGSGGTTSLPLGTAAKVMAVQADGKIILAGTYSDGSGKQFVISRFNSDGAPDNSFDGDGYVITDFGSPEEEIRSVAIQTDGKIVATGYTVLAGSTRIALARYDVNGTLDNSFDGDGMLTASFGTTNDIGGGVAIQADGKIIVSGYANTTAALARFTAAGVLDNSFDGDGKMVTTTFVMPQEPLSVAIQNDGKIVVAPALPNDYGLLRFNSDGSPDNSFDGDGITTMDIAGNGDRAKCMAIQGNGRIFVAGYSINNHSDFSIACFQQNGTPDNSFNGNGKIDNVWNASFDLAHAIAIQSDGKIIVAGDTGREDLATTNDFALARYNTDGTLDNTFDGDGRLSFTIGIDETFYALAVQPDGKILAAGVGQYQWSISKFDVSVVRLNPDGSRDNTFGGDGLVFVVPSSDNDMVTSIAVQSDGKVLIAGANWVFRLNTNGSLDNSFDGDGRINTPIGTYGFLAIQNDGKILVAGANNSDFAIARYTSTGAIDNSFDGDGMVTTDFGSAEWISSIKVQSDGKIVAGGGSGNNFAIARYNSDGTLDNSFDGDGKQTTDMNGTAGTGVLPYTLDIQSNGKIVMSGQTRNTSDDFILARYNTDGTLDNSFDGDGKATVDFAPGSNDHMAGMAISSNRIYMAGWVLTPGGFDFALAAIVADPLLGPLPLQLRDFSGKRINDDALLSWKTENETNMLEYTVERSVDGRNYSAVGTVTAANRAGMHYYNLTDQNITSLNASVIYYRLKEKGIDGKFSHSRIIALALDKNKNIVLFYPNPVINEANIALTVNRQDKLQVRIIDNKGRVMKQQQWNVTAGSTSLSLDVKNLAAGMYYLEIKGESIDYKKPFIK